MKSKETNIKILVCYHKKDKLFKNDVLVPIHCGRALACEASKDGKMSEKDYQWMLDNMIGDDTGDNISELNREVNEMSAIYWAWKNYDKLGNPDYIGLMHYRRLFDFFEVSTFSKKSLLDRLGLNKKTLDAVFSKCDFVCRKGFNVIDTKHTFEPYQISVNLSNDYHPILFNKYQKFKKEQIFYFSCMFIMKKDDFFEFCEEVMPIMFDFLEMPKSEVNNNFLSKVKDLLSEEKYNLVKEKAISNQGCYPRITAYMMEYILSFYFDYLLERYKNRAFVTDVYIPMFQTKYSLLERIFSVKNSSDKKHKIISIFGIRVKIKR